MGDTTAGKLGGIEACRGIAATMVVVHHVARHLDKAYGIPISKNTFQFGAAGVDLFFVISGFIILHVHRRDIGRPARLGHYFGRRFTRVMPTYWVAMLLTLLMGFAGRKGLPSFAELAWSVTLLPSNGDLILSIAWTLQYEIVFYTAVCVLILNRAAGIVMFGLWLAGIVLTTVSKADVNWLPRSLYAAYNLEFFFGIFVADLLRRVRVPSPKLVLVAGVVLFAAAAAAEDLQFMIGQADISRIAYGVPAAMIVLGTAASGLRAPVTTPPLLRTLGSASYSIYLFQFIFIGTAWQLWQFAGLDKVMPHAASFPLLAVAGVVGGVLASRLIEYPLIRLVRGHRRRIPAGAAVG